MAHVNAGGNNFQVDRIPGVCPKCHHSIAPISIGGGVHPAEYQRLEVPYSCPNCHRMFLAIYSQQGAINNQFRYIECEPVYPEASSFGRIDPLSPRFVTIYNQSKAAEGYGLDEIAGTGFRKSLEFLIKDYSIYKNPTEEAQIRSALLGTVIEKFVDEERIKQAAKRTAWLGNDESHYERRWIDQDLQDLKNLLTLTITGITGVLEYDYYMQKMTPGGPSTTT
jgi:hypothetical protein